MLKDEMNELTELLRTEPILEDLRRAILAHGIDPNTAKLVGFIENGEGLEAGVLFSPDMRCFEFERNVLKSTHFVVWREILDLADIEGKFPTAVAIIHLLK
ncbi:hypothetical protein NG895_11440 [Aeoliella sp. ICT_H6.2]|uniref:Uncharacterized protein n=1 Tax=Aeoliella straminimaris TaxID=2954799 RepID=A0A9X2JJ13_9BACT|nr:hypothetical protein [Aeoliella straminimaris]MCO6044519.1 hypothetical protein [Aeoliella straminimaris]